MKIDFLWTGGECSIYDRLTGFADVFCDGEGTKNMATMMKGPAALFVLALAQIEEQSVRDWAEKPHLTAHFTRIAETALAADPSCMHTGAADFARLIEQLHSSTTNVTAHI